MRTSLLCGLLLVGCSAPTPVPTPVAAPTATPMPSAVPNPSGPIIYRVLTYDLPWRPSALTFEPDGTAWLVCDGRTYTIAPGGQPVVAPLPPRQASQIVVNGPDVWLNDDGFGVARFNRQGKLQASYPVGNTDWTSVPFTVDVDGNLWVSYNFANKAYKYAPDGKLLLELPGMAARAYFNDADGNIKVCAANRILTVRRDGGILDEVATCGNIDQCALDGFGNVWAYDQDGHAILKFEASGRTVVRTLDGYLGSLAVSGEGSVWYTDQGATLHRMSPTGTLLNQFDLGTPAFVMDPQQQLWASYEVKQDGMHFSGQAKVFQIAR